MSEQMPLLPHDSFVTRLPVAIRFSLLCLSSLILSSVAYSFVAVWAGSELASVSRHVSDTWQIATFIAWKFFGLSVAWYAGYDYQDLASLACLSNLPYYYLLAAFYDVGFVPCAVSALIDTAAVAIPFALFQPLVPARRTSTNAKSANQEVAQDRSVYGLLSVLGAAVYSLIIYGSFYTWLPVHMVIHFDGLRSVEKAHSTGILLLVALLLPVGFASTHFLFAPTIASPANPGLTRSTKAAPGASRLNPETATLAQTVAWNVGYGPDGWSARSELFAKRTAALIVATFANTFVRVLFTIEGTEAVGAAGWASVWAFASLATGVAFSWVGDE